MRTIKKLSEKEEKTIVIDNKTMTGKLIVELITEDNRVPTLEGWYLIDQSLPCKETIVLTFISDEGEVWFREYKKNWELLLG